VRDLHQRQGSGWSGWLPAVADGKAEPVGPADWFGKWSGVEAGITVKGGKAGALHIEGDATYGSVHSFPDIQRDSTISSARTDSKVPLVGINCLIYQTRCGLV
jgi:hypothetical protein